MSRIGRRSLCWITLPFYKPGWLVVDNLEGFLCWPWEKITISEKWQVKTNQQKNCLGGSWQCGLTTVPLGPSWLHASRLPHTRNFFLILKIYTNLTDNLGPNVFFLHMQKHHIESQRYSYFSEVLRTFGAWTVNSLFAVNFWGGKKWEQTLVYEMGKNLTNFSEKTCELNCARYCEIMTALTPIK